MKNNNINVRLLSSKIYNNINRRQRGFIIPFISELRTIDVKLFTVFNFQHYPKTYVYELMIEYKYFLEELTLEDWFKIASNLNGHKVSLTNFISFVCKFIKIDFLELLIVRKVLNEELIKWLETSFEDRKALKNFGIMEQKMLEFHNTRIDDFRIIKDLFLKNGARKLDENNQTSIPPLHGYVYDEESKNYKKID